MKIKSAIITLCVLWYASTANAAEIVAASVIHEKGVYNVTFEVFLDADTQQVRKIVTDYDRLHQLSTTIIESRVVVRDGSRTRVSVLMRPCVWLIFCRTIRKVTDATVTQDGSIHHRTVASQSDFSFAEEQLSVRAGTDHRGAHVRYQAELVPKFFVPPLIGPWLVRRQIVQELTETAAAIERAAASGSDAGPVTPKN